MLAAWHAFVLNEHSRRPTPGMPVFYERLTRAYRDAPVVHLSTGAWNVAPTLTRFRLATCIPPAPCYSPIGTDRDQLVPQRNGPQTQEPGTVDRRVSEREVVLIGDDGQHDEEIYGNFVTSHTDGWSRSASAS